MKKMSKWLAILLALCLCLSLCACVPSFDSGDDYDDDDYDYDFDYDSDVATSGVTAVTVPTISWPDYTQNQNNDNATQSQYIPAQTTQNQYIPTQTTQRPTAAQSGNNINVPALPVAQHTVPALPQSTTTMKEATFKTFTGSIATKNEADKFTYTPPRDGTYRFDLINIVSGPTFALTVYDSLGAQVQRQSNMGNDDGYVINNMKGGQKYTIELKQYYDFGNYTIRVGEQTATVDVSSYSVVKDSIVFTGQRNRYTFIPARDGRYQLEFAEVKSGTSFSLYVYNNLGEVVQSQTNVRNNSGVRVDMIGGDRYTIEVRQYDASGAYQLKIGKQKATVNVTNYSAVSDSIEFTNQRNYYTFAPDVTGRYRFEFANVVSGTAFSLYVFNDLGETVQSQTSVINGGGLTVSELEAGEVYTIMVQQYSGSGSYILKIGKQKETVSARVGATIKDSIEYDGQYNNYTFAATSSAHTLTLSGMPGGTGVTIYVYNSLGERVAYQTSMTNGGTLNIRNLTAGQTYTIQVRHYSGTGSYSLKIS